MSRSRSWDIGLAPMEGVTELSFRLWLAQTSAPTFAFTPFLRATDSFPAAVPALFMPEQLWQEHLPYTLIPQVMTADSADFIRTAHLLLPLADFIDLNCGCPAPSPVKGGAGSSLLRQVDHFHEFIGDIAAALPARRLSVKMRTGFDDAQMFYDLVQGLADLPLKQLTIHGRTRADRYDGKSRWDLIEDAARALPFRVIGSGDILSAETLKKAEIDAPSAAGAMIGRGALRNPWLFKELSHGSAVKLSGTVLRLALACYGLLLELGRESMLDRLQLLVRRGLWQRVAGTDQMAWEELYAELASARGGEELVIDRPALGRVKMVWNYLRSSLPLRYQEPTLLRSTSLKGFLSQLADLDPDDEPFTVGHQEPWDWLYTTSRHKPELIDHDRAHSPVSVF